MFSKRLSHNALKKKNAILDFLKSALISTLLNRDEQPYVDSSECIARGVQTPGVASKYMENSNALTRGKWIKSSIK